MGRKAVFPMFSLSKTHFSNLKEEEVALLTLKKENYLLTFTYCLLQILNLSNAKMDFSDERQNHQ